MLERLAWIFWINHRAKRRKAKTILDSLRNTTEISLLSNTQNNFTYLEQEDSWITEEGNKGHKDLGVLHKQLPSGLEAGKEWKEMDEDNLTFRFKNDFSAMCRSGVRIFGPLKLVPGYRSPSLSLTFPLHFPRFFLVLLRWLPKTRLGWIWNRGLPKLREGERGRDPNLSKYQVYNTLFA